jgi:hypothetical protein
MTALFARIMMNREMHNRKWRALTLVVLGAMLITNERRPAEAKQGVAMMSYFVGLGACLLEITLSGAISIYFEKVLKRTTTPHSVRLVPLPPSPSPSPPPLPLPGRPCPSHRIKVFSHVLGHPPW